jgi:hypothetical protein
VTTVTLGSRLFFYSAANKLTYIGVPYPTFLLAFPSSIHNKQQFFFIALAFSIYNKQKNTPPQVPAAHAAINLTLRPRASVAECGGECDGVLYMYII